MTYTALLDKITSGALDAGLAPLYGPAVDARRARLADAVKAFGAEYGTDGELMILSVPGRSELSGNHTDHNHGRVIAASIDLDIVAVIRARADMTVRVKSEGFPEDVVDIAAYTEPDESKFYTSASLIAGMAACFRDSGKKVGGFDAYTTSNVFKGSGLSSSAAFEVMIGSIYSHLFNNGEIDRVEIAKWAQIDENRFFGKPCGLMDQVACAHGGIVAIDFADPAKPVITPVDFDLSAAGYTLCIVNTGGNHADLNADYASVPAEMKAVAAELGVSVLREADEEQLIAAIPALREKVGDRAILRALHFVAENKRVAAQTESLLAGKLDGFLAGVLASGRSSFCYLQNVYTTINVAEQGLSLALALTERALTGVDGAAWRVHGGGFAGTIQAFVPVAASADYAKAMDAVFGDGACHILHVRNVGATRIA
ncbi:MAG: galactokinase [Clostridia bacterium]|nr:galactokinase [Clostridia bacterium]